MEDYIFENEKGEEISVKKLLSDRMEIILRNAHRGMKRKYRKEPLWSFISDLTGYGSTYSIKICKGLGWNPDQDANKQLKQLEVK